jgi:hypothetical protein
MDSARRIAVVAGVLFIAAAVAAIAGLALYGPVLHDPHYVVTASGGDARVLGGAFCEVILAISVIGTAVTLFPVIKWQNEALALGYVAGRIVEAVVIVVGIISLLSVVTLRQDFAGAGGGAKLAGMVALGQALVAVHNWTFLFGPGFAIGLNTLMLAYLMYRSGLVPRLIAVIGLAGGPLMFASSAAVLFGLYPQLSAWGAIAAVPVFTWEMSLAVWLLVRGFMPARNATAGHRAAGLGAVPAAGLDEASAAGLDAALAAG